MTKKDTLTFLPTLPTDAPLGFNVDPTQAIGENLSLQLTDARIPFIIAPTTRELLTQLSQGVNIVFAAHFGRELTSSTGHDARLTVVINNGIVTELLLPSSLLRSTASQDQEQARLAVLGATVGAPLLARSIVEGLSASCGDTDPLVQNGQHFAPVARVLQAVTSDGSPNPLQAISIETPLQSATHMHHLPAAEAKNLLLGAEEARVIGAVKSRTYQSVAAWIRADGRLAGIRYLEVRMQDGLVAALSIDPGSGEKTLETSIILHCLANPRVEESVGTLSAAMIKKENESLASYLR